MLGVRETLAESIIRIWRDNDTIRAEFGRFNCFAAFMEAGPEAERDRILAENSPDKLKQKLILPDTDAVLERMYDSEPQYQKEFGTVGAFKGFAKAAIEGKIRARSRA